MMSKFSELLKARSVLLADGATGTNQFGRGLEAGASPELWNVGTPHEVSKVESLHSEFVKAGSDIILTNTFGANRSRLELHKAEKQAVEINYRGAQIARYATRDSDSEVLVAGSIGPTGEIFEPLGPLSIPEAAEIFEEQGSGLMAGGVDCFWIETMSSWEELDAAIQGLARFNLPIIATVSFDTAGHTMMGISPVELYKGLRGRVDGFGANCGIGPEGALRALKEIKSAELLQLAIEMEEANPHAFLANQATLAIKANCGVPVFQGADIVYEGTPELMAAYVGIAAQTGAKIIGGCCGTTPVHVKAMREALDLYLATQKPREVKEKPSKIRRRG